METGAQTADSFNCQIRWVINCQEALNFINRLFIPPFSLHHTFRKFFCYWDTCIDINTKFFKLLGGFYSSTQENSK
ncbi:Uncharacterised protein [Klebsiella pneumoniae]|nr:Uncharacterised protein [Klebsiella pneumoniae]